MGSGSSHTSVEKLGAPVQDTGKMSPVKNNNIGEVEPRNGYIGYNTPSPQPQKQESKWTKTPDLKSDLNDADELTADLDKEFHEGHRTLRNSSRTSANVKSAKIENFDSDTDDFDQQLEEEKILNEYIEATHRESYPETYAEKMRRQRYQNQIDMGGFEPVPDRMYSRPSNDWELEQDIEGFDPKRFKAVNNPQPTSVTESTSQSKTEEEIGASYIHDNTSQSKSTGLKYDVTEEQLMQDIEKEFDDYFV